MVPIKSESSSIVHFWFTSLMGNSCLSRDTSLSEPLIAEDVRASLADPVEIIRVANPVLYEEVDDGNDDGVGVGKKSPAAVALSCSFDEENDDKEKSKVVSWDDEAKSWLNLGVDSEALTILILYVNKGKSNKREQ